MGGDDPDVSIIGSQSGQMMWVEYLLRLLENPKRLAEEIRLFIEIKEDDEKRVKKAEKNSGDTHEPSPRSPDRGSKRGKKDKKDAYKWMKECIKRHLGEETSVASYLILYNLLPYLDDIREEVENKRSPKPFLEGLSYAVAKTLIDQSRSIGRALRLIVIDSEELYREPVQGDLLGSLGDLVICSYRFVTLFYNKRIFLGVRNIVRREDLDALKDVLKDYLVESKRNSLKECVDWRGRLRSRGFKGFFSEKRIEAYQEGLHKALIQAAGLDPETLGVVVYSSGKYHRVEEVVIIIKPPAPAGGPGVYPIKIHIPFEGRGPSIELPPRIKSEL